MAVGTVAVLSIMAAAAASSVSQELRLSSFLTDSNTSCYYAMSAVNAMKAYFKYLAAPGITILRDLRPRSFLLGERKADVLCYDEEGLVNISSPSPSVISRLPGIDGNQALVAAIMARQPKATEDLLSIDGMTQEIYVQMKDLVTVYGDGRVNVNTAGPAVLAALGFSTELIDRLKAFRAGEDAEEGTEDDGIVADINKLTEQLLPYGLTPAEKAFLEGLILSSQIKQNSGFIRLQVEVVQGPKVLRVFQIVIDKGSGKIKRWGEQ